MTELSSIGKIKRALTVARVAETGCELTRFDVIELHGFIADMEQVYAENRARPREDVLTAEVETLRRVIDMFATTGERVLFALNEYGFDTRNGNICFGIDEGEYIGGEMASLFIKELDAALAEYAALPQPPLFEPS